MSKTIVVLALAALAGSAAAGSAENEGGGEFVFDRSEPCLTDTQRSEIQADVERNVATLRALGLLAPDTPAAVPLSFPLACLAPDFDCHAISAFVDHNLAFPNLLQDYNCGTRTYDTASGNHTGTDIFTWPFAWSKMEGNEVAVIAAAPGTIVARYDGNYDRNCAAGNLQWNGVNVQHADGSVAWYGHMKKNSVTPKAVGQAVAAGEYLGIVGSSGSSTGPHLHFELRSAANAVIDPFQGGCNAISSWWSAQRPYYDSAINKLATHSAGPVFPACPTTETPNIRDAFAPGASATFAAYYHDQLAGQSTQYTIFKPNGAVWQTWSAASSTAHSSASYWWWSRTLPAAGPAGLWKFRAVFNGQTREVPFMVQEKGDYNADGQADLLLQNATTNRVLVWLMDGVTRVGSAYVSPDPAAGWKLAAADDFNLDHKSDLVFRNTSTGAVEFWMMNGTARSGAAVPLGGAAAPGLSWRLAASGDFNADGLPDLVWHDLVSAKYVIWTMNGANKIGSIVPTPDSAADANWSIVAAQDYNADGIRDLLWWNATTGKIVIWQMNASVVRTVGYFTTPSQAGDNNWQVAAGANYGIGPLGLPATNDIAWRNATSGKLVIWHLDTAGKRTAGRFTTPDSPGDLNWTVAGPR